MSSYRTWDAPGEAAASRYCVPETVAPFDGSTMLVIGGSTLIVAGLVGVETSYAGEVRGPPTRSGRR